MHVTGVLRTPASIVTTKRVNPACLVLLALMAPTLKAVPVPSGAAASPEHQEPARSTSQEKHPLRGMVWRPPQKLDAALRELRRIHDTGATAVRLTRPPDTDPLLTLADSLGLQLFVDLPVGPVSAPALSGALQAESETLDRLLRFARQHTSLQYIGLARSADTTVPRACSVLKTWTRRIHARSDSTVKTYYLTPFPASADRCADAVDLPLLEVRAAPHPKTQWETWRSVSAAVGLGAVGTWVRPGAPTGLKVPHSQERQARYLERTLSGLLDSSSSGPPAVFVSRWRDRAVPLLSSRRYGLHTPDGTPRPAATVVRGFYTGEQRTFAFPTGSEPESGPFGPVLLGWALLALLGGLYARSLFVRRTLSRYFYAPGFYRDALREGHNLHPGANGLLLSIVTASIGLTSIRTARLAAPQPAAERVLSAVPPELTSVLATALEHPIATGIVVAGGVLGLLVVWMGALILVARRWSRLSIPQGLVLVTWPCWPALLALPLALAAAPDSVLSPSRFGLLLLAGSLLTLISHTARVLVDYHTITRLPGWLVAGLSLLSPLFVLMAFLFVLVEQYEVPIQLVWRLATLT